MLVEAAVLDAQHRVDQDRGKVAQGTVGEFLRPHPAEGRAIGGFQQQGRFRRLGDRSVERKPVQSPQHGAGERQRAADAQNRNTPNTRKRTNLQGFRARPASARGVAECATRAVSKLRSAPRAFRNSRPADAVRLPVRGGDSPAGFTPAAGPRSRSSGLSGMNDTFTEGQRRADEPAWLQRARRRGGSRRGCRPPLARVDHAGPAGPLSANSRPISAGTARAKSGLRLEPAQQPLPHAPVDHRAQRLPREVEPDEHPGAEARSGQHRHVRSGVRQRHVELEQPLERLGPLGVARSMEIAPPLDSASAWLGRSVRRRAPRAPRTTPGRCYGRPAGPGHRPAGRAPTRYRIAAPLPGRPAPTPASHSPPQNPKTPKNYH